MNDFGSDFIPTHLPCGKQINYDGKSMQCCRTECLEKSNQQIDECYDIHKYGHYRDLQPKISHC